ncbi:MAG: 1-acyl-sn-glycerol-3-phosphate acyltransferase [Lachnospiraceae bacterium]
MRHFEKVKLRKEKYYRVTSHYICLSSLLHPIFLRIVPIIRRYRLLPFQCNETPKGQVIFAVNHSNIHDIPTIWEVVKKHVYVLAGDEPRGDFNGIALTVNGVIWVKRDSKKSKNNAKNNMLKLLEKNKNLLIFSGSYMESNSGKADASSTLGNYRIGSKSRMSDCTCYT